VGSNVTNRAASLVNQIQKQILADVAGSDDANGATAQSTQGYRTA